MNSSTSTFHWSCKHTWKRSAKNTAWCVLGCAIGDFGTILYFQLTQIPFPVLGIMILAIINGTGRTDFQNGSSKDAYNSIFNRLLKLPSDTILYPGHDYNGKKSSTIGNEIKFNPRLQVNSVDEYVELMSNLNLAKPKLIDRNVSRNIKLGAN